jgi:predicted small metal-binding protein
MVNIRCKDYGFDCDFVSLGKIEGVVFEYWQHMNDTHGIDYSKGTIGEFITKKRSILIQ